MFTVADPGGGGKGGKGGNGTPFSEKELHAYFLAINDPALAISLSSSWLENIRDYTLGLVTLQITHTKKIKNSQPHPPCCMNSLKISTSATGLIDVKL